MDCRNGEPTMITVTIWHNVAQDHERRNTAMLEGYQPGDSDPCACSVARTRVRRHADQLGGIVLALPGVFAAQRDAVRVRA